MPVTADIIETYRRPRQVVARLLAMGPREDRVLVMLMGGCALAFTSQMPRLAREAHFSGQDLNMMLGGALLGWIFIAPLLLYGLSLVTHIAMRVIGGRCDSYGSRLALVWAFLAASPLFLLNGLTAGFIGPGPSLNLVGGAWLVFLLWFWFSGLREAYWTSR